VDTICEIVGRWPGLEKRIIMREGEKMREIRYPGKSEEIVKSGFQNVFSTQSKKTLKAGLYQTARLADGSWLE
jgi:hypothetical protein